MHPIDIVLYKDHCLPAAVQQTHTDAHVYQPLPPRRLPFSISVDELSQLVSVSSMTTKLTTVDFVGL